MFLHILVKYCFQKSPTCHKRTSRKSFTNNSHENPKRPTFRPSHHACSSPNSRPRHPFPFSLFRLTRRTSCCRLTLHDHLSRWTRSRRDSYPSWNLRRDWRQRPGLRDRDCLRLCFAQSTASAACHGERDNNKEKQQDSGDGHRYDASCRASNIARVCAWDRRHSGR